MTSIFTNIVGYAATVVGTCLMLPQIIKSWKTRSVRDLSFGMVVLYFFNCLLWLTYGILLGAPPVVIANGIGLLISIVQVGLKMKYR
jgi:MtN3 and saliva related transmembrane protein